MMKVFTAAWSRRLGQRALVLAATTVVAFGCSKTSSEAPADASSWRDPDLLVPDANGVYALRMTPSKVTIDGKDFCLRTYGGKLSPMISVDAAAQPRRIRVEVKNDFTTMDEKAISGKSCGQPDELHHFNMTNFHTHGLHVPPEKTADGMFQSDNVLLDIHPGTAAVQYRFDIDEPKVHEAGTFWFHSHVHGSTSIQVANGVAGALIVRGAVDDLPGIRAARERVFLFQQIPYDFVDDKDPSKSVKPLTGECNEANLSIDDFAAVTAAKRTLVNGVLAPTIEVHKNAVERWRFIHAGISQELAIGLRNQNADGSCNFATADDPSRVIPLSQIAADGFTYAAAETVDEVVMEPGYRADVMMKAPAAAGTYCVVDVPSTQGLQGGAEVGNILAYLKVDDVEAAAGAGTMPADADLARVAHPVLDCAAPLTIPSRPLVFAQQKDPVTKELCEGGCPRPFFNVNCKKFDENRAPTALPFGETEEWLLSSEWSDHPFHIHINAFTVCAGAKIRGTVTSTPHWKDTIFVRQSDTSVGEELEALTTTPIRIRTTYEDFKGKFVMHCHKLQHEDEGMMQQVEIK